MILRTKGPSVLLAIVVLAAVAGPAALAEETKVERQKIVVKTGEGPDDVWVWESDGGENEAAGRSWLGVGLREETKLSEGGARVTTVVSGSPAEKAGLRDGDVIVGFEGEVIRGPAKLTEKIHETKPGQSVELDIMREGSRRTVTAEIGERKSVVRIFGRGGKGEPPIGTYENLFEFDHGALEENLRGLGERMPELEKKLSELDRGRTLRFLEFRGSGGPKLGVELVETTPELREHLGGKAAAGVLVGKVLPGSAAEKAGLKVGDLIVRAGNDEIRDSGNLIEAVRANAGKTLNLEVVREGRAATIKATIPEPAPEDAPRGPRAGRLLTPAAARIL